MDVGFTGSRDYRRPDLVEDFVRKLAAKYPDIRVISGGRGVVDQSAEQTALEEGLEVISYRPHEDHIEVVRMRYGMSSSSKVHGFNNWVKNAFLRNEYIAGADRVVAFWDGVSRGTADTISKARGKGRELFVYGPAGDLNSEMAVSLALREVLG